MLRLSGLAAERVLPEAYRLKTPASPHLAAEIDGVTIDPEALILPETDRPLVVEGAGGLLVPLTRERHLSSMSSRAGARRWCFAPAPHSAPSITRCCRSRRSARATFRCSASPSSARTMTKANASSPRWAGSGVSAVFRMLTPLTGDTLRAAFAQQFRYRRFSEGVCRMRSTSPVWHPFTQHAVQPEAPLIARGEGAWLETADGRRIFDAISSWWVITHGHRHPHIVQAIKDQADSLDQVIFAGFTHQPAEELARQPRRDHAAGARIRVLFRQRLDLGRSRAENGAGLLAAPRRAAQPHPRAGRRLSWRHHRRHVGRRARRLQRPL